MAIDVSTSQLLNGYSRFFHRYHVILFVVIALGGLSIAILMLYQTVQTSTDTTAITESVEPGFDKNTIERLRTLKPAGTGDPLKLPDTRTSPFVE